MTTPDPILARLTEILAPYGGGDRALRAQLRRLIADACVETARNAVFGVEPSILSPSAQMWLDEYERRIRVRFGP